MAKTRDHRQEHQRRNARARELGFRNHYEMRKLGGASHLARTAEALPPDAQASRRASLEAVALMRREGLPLAPAARRVGVSPSTVRFWAGEAVGAGGRVRPGDRIPRSMLIATSGRVIVAEVRGSRQSSLLADYWNDVDRFLNTADMRLLARYRGKSVAGHILETDPDVLENLALEGEMTFEDIYSLTG